ncbi:glycine betaine/L-proline transporter ProP [Brackiella oedipodis]|uniref:glycine betaine/L-proline transporter ProP n=1 Tax=Brackiella oedipodis TaxID=124225 RepID=UPI000491A1F1|nr:glycine betaine/L-proline transporter ProP [Brackiella oedipodis]
MKAPIQTVKNKLKRKKREPISIDDITIVDDKSVRKAITAASLGNALEWFDFGVYGFLATVLGQMFFPGSDPSIQLIAALATFSLPFVLRPLGGLIFGVLGDKYGRQKVLSTTIVMMTISTAGIGLIPSYHNFESWGLWGIIAPCLLLICKVFQGISVGGEYAGACIFVAEYAPDRRRGFLGSWLDFGSMSGFVVGAGVVIGLNILMGDEIFHSWGWRIPFLLALPLGMIGIYLRHALEETPAFQKSMQEFEGKGGAEKKAAKFSFRELLATQKRGLIVCIGIVFTQNALYYTLLTYMPSYLQHNLDYTEKDGLWIVIVVILGLLCVQPLIGYLSDKFGRRLFILLGSFAMLLLPIPAYYLITHESLTHLFFGLLILSSILCSLIGVTASTVPALFPTRYRYSALTSGYNVAVLVAGLTPALLALLIKFAQDAGFYYYLYVPALFLMAVSIVGISTGFFFRETANKPLHGASPTASNLEEAQELLQEHHDGISEKIDAISAEIERLQRKRQDLLDQHPERND